jgi:hypothetical protein
VQRAYRARLAAAGKVHKLLDADTVADLAMLDRMRERLHDALSKLELHEQEVARLTARNHHLENELKQLERHHTNALKEIITLKQAAAASALTRTDPGETQDKVIHGRDKVLPERQHHPPIKCYRKPK